MTAVDVAAGAGGNIPAAAHASEASGGMWIMLSKIVSQASQLFIFVLAASTLTPEQFGHFAVGAAVALFFVILAEAGWAEIIMKNGDDEQTLSEVSAFAVASGGILFAVSLAGIGIFSRLGGDSGLVVLLLLFATWTPLAALTTIYDGHLVYRRRFRLQSFIRIASELTGLAGAVAGLVAGWGVYALVLSRAGTLLIYLVLCASCAGIRPRLRLQLGHAPEMTRFSIHILQGRMITFFRSYAATLSIGAFLGAAEAGLFRLAERIVAASAELLGEPARMIGWGIFRRARHDAEHESEPGARLSDAGASYIPLVLAISLPVYLGIPLVADNFFALTFGEAWQPAALITAILAIKQLALVPAYVSEPLLSIAGNIRRLPPVSLFNAVVAVAAVAVTAPFGYVAVAWGQVGAAVVALGTTLLLQSRYGHQDWLRIARLSAPIGLATLICLMAAALAGHLPLQAPLAVLTLQIGCGALAYGGALWLLHPNALRDIWRLSR